MRARGHDSWQESLAGDSIALDEDDFKDLLQHVTDRNQDWTRERKLPGRSVRHNSGKQTRNLAFSKYLQISPSLPCTKTRETTAVTGMKEIVLARCPAYLSKIAKSQPEIPDSKEGAALEETIACSHLPRTLVGRGRMGLLKHRQAESHKDLKICPASHRLKSL